MTLLLAGGADIEAKNNYGNTALILAARYGHDKVVTLLLAGGADIEDKNGSGDTALILAAYNGHDKVVTLLLSKSFYSSRVVSHNVLTPTESKK